MQSYVNTRTILIRDLKKKKKHDEIGRVQIKPNLVNELISGKKKNSFNQIIL